MIVFVGGLIGAGKSTVARALAERHGLYYYDVDEVKKTVFRDDPDYEHNLARGIPFSDRTRIKVYDTAIEELKRLYRKHSCIVVDETLYKRELRHHLYEAADTHFDGYFVIWVQADEAVIGQRLTRSVRKNHLLADPMSMHKSMLETFEDFERSVIVCQNNTDIESTMIDLDRFLDAIFQFGQRTFTHGPRTSNSAPTST